MKYAKIIILLLTVFWTSEALGTYDTYESNFLLEASANHSVEFDEEYDPKELLSNPLVTSYADLVSQKSYTSPIRYISYSIPPFDVPPELKP